MRKMDGFAAEMIPIRFIISIAVISAVMLMVAFGYSNLTVILSENQLENECRILESKLSTMLGSGVARDVDEANAGEGTKRTHMFDLPDSLIYLSFGVDPDNYESLGTGLTSDGAVIFYRVNGGSKHVIWLPQDFKFREGNYTDDKWVINGDGQGFIITNDGKTTLTFELVEKNHERYILIQANDKINP